MGCVPSSTLVQMGELKRGAEALRLLLHVVDQLGPLDALRPAGKVFDKRGDGELSAGLVALKNQRFQSRARGVDGRRKPGAAGAKDHGVANFSHKVSHVDSRRFQHAARLSGAQPPLSN